MRSFQTWSWKRNRGTSRCLAPDMRSLQNHTAPTATSFSHGRKWREWSQNLGQAITSRTGPAADGIRCVYIQYSFVLLHEPLTWQLLVQVASCTWAWRFHCLSILLHVSSISDSFDSSELFFLLASQTSIWRIHTDARWRRKSSGCSDAFLRGGKDYIRSDRCNTQVFFQCFWGHHIAICNLS